MEILCAKWGQDVRPAHLHPMLRALLKCDMWDLDLIWPKIPRVSQVSGTLEDTTNVTCDILIWYDLRYHTCCILTWYDRKYHVCHMFHHDWIWPLSGLSKRVLDPFVLLHTRKKYARCSYFVVEITPPMQRALWLPYPRICSPRVHLPNMHTHIYCWRRHVYLCTDV